MRSTTNLVSVKILSLALLLISALSQIVIKDNIIFKKQGAVWEMSLAGFNSIDKTNNKIIFKLNFFLQSFFGGQKTLVQYLKEWFLLSSLENKVFSLISRSNSSINSILPS